MMLKQKVTAPGSLQMAPLQMAQSHVVPLPVISASVAAVAPAPARRSLVPPKTESPLKAPSKPAASSATLHAFHALAHSATHACRSL